VGRRPKLIQSLVSANALGFLLQKGGVAKFDILAGVLLLEKLVVAKVMLSVVVVGMLEVYVVRAGL